MKMVIAEQKYVSCQGIVTKYCYS